MNTKSRTTAAILAIIVGDFGIHKFYLGKVGQGIIYLLLFWTWIPGIIGFIEGIVYLTMSDQAFQEKYGNGYSQQQYQQPYQQPYQQQPQYNPQGQNKFCPSCGTRVDTSTKFCPHCGNQIM